MTGMNPLSRVTGETVFIMCSESLLKMLTVIHLREKEKCHLNQPFMSSSVITASEIMFNIIFIKSYIDNKSHLNIIK
jgi:hypothetical protein